MGVNMVCRSRNSLRSALVQVKQPPEDRKKKGVVCHVYHARPRTMSVCTLGKQAGPLRSAYVSTRMWLKTWHQQWDGSPCLNQRKPSGLEGRQDKRNGKELLEEKGTGSPAHLSIAAHLQLGLWSGNQSFLAAAAWLTHLLLTHSCKHIHHLIILISFSFYSHFNFILIFPAI